MKKSNKRPPIPRAVQNAVLLGNRHACCVCQRPRVQLHHIDGNSANNDPENIAALCLDHHDMASMQTGLTKKLQPDQIRTYKAAWEGKCRNDFQALSRKRFTFFYCMYKNPPRLLEAFYSLSDAERNGAAARIGDRLRDEQSAKDAGFFSFAASSVPQVNDATLEALQSVADGEKYPSYLGRFKSHPADPNYSTDLSTQAAMVAYHKYDLWCQIVAQTLAEARGTIPIEDLFKFGTDEEMNAFEGSLVTFALSVHGKGLRPPGMWEEHPVASLQARTKIGKQIFRVKMQLRTMYLFSDTASVNLRQARASGLGIFLGATKNDAGEIEVALVPLLIGTGGWDFRQ